LKSESVKSKAAFEEFMNKLIKDNHLDSKIKDKFLFLTFENYSTHPNTKKFIVYEDWWQRKPEIVKSKILSILQISRRLYGRQCEVRKINKTDADAFLNENHICGSTNSKIKYGLFYKGELVSLATFAAQRTFRDSSRSAELLRFCSKNGCMVVGGLDKLIQAYIKDYAPDDIMTYVNKDWGNGDAFKKIGFKKTDTVSAVSFYVNRKKGERIPEKYFRDFENTDLYVKINNKGSLKMKLKI